MKDIEKFLDSISIKINEKPVTQCRLQTVLKRYGGYTKRGTKFITKFNTALKDKGLITSPIVTINTPRLKDDWIYFKYNSGVVTTNNVISQRTKEVFKMDKKFIPYPHQNEAWNNMDKHYPSTLIFQHSLIFQLSHLLIQTSKNVFLEKLMLPTHTLIHF